MRASERGSIAFRPKPVFSEGKLEGWVAEADEVYALFNNNRDDFAPRSARILRGLLDEAGVPAAGAVEPAPEAQLHLEL